MAGSLRDQLSENFDLVEKENSQPPEPAPPATAESIPPKDSTVAVAESQEKPGRTTGRPRDEKGRLLPGKPVKDGTSAAQPGTGSQTQDLVTDQTAVAAETKPRPARPTTWKKEYWDHWEKIDPDLAQYLVQRESEFAKGVSTYKQEWENAKPLLEAIAPYRPVLTQYGIDPAQHIDRMFRAHQTLALGNPAEKLGMFIRLAQDYQVPIQQLLVKGEDGQVYFNPQYAVQAQGPAQQQQPHQDIDAVIESKLIEREAAMKIANAKADTATYPHFDEVSETMAGLLQSGLATDIADAYEAALHHPRHADLLEHDQKLARETDEKRSAEEKHKQAEAAKRKAVSPKSATPTAPTAGTNAKGLRATLESNFDEVFANRV